MVAQEPKLPVLALLKGMTREMQAVCERLEMRDQASLNKSAACKPAWLPAGAHY